MPSVIQLHETAFSTGSVAPGNFRDEHLTHVSPTWWLEDSHPPHSTPESVFQHEELRIQGSQRTPKFGELRFRAGDFQTHELRKLEAFLQQIAHILEMRQQPVRICIRLTAMHQVAIETETVVKHPRFSLRPGDKAFAQALKVREFAGSNLEIGRNRATAIRGSHERNGEFELGCGSDDFQQKNQ